MSPALPIISGRAAVKALQQIGFEVVPKRGKGSHIVMARKGHPAIVTIPDHRELDRGTLRSIIRSAGLSVDQFTALL